MADAQQGIVAVLERVAPIVERGAVVTGYAGASATTYMGLTIDQWSVVGIWFGMGMTILGFGVGTALNIWYKRRLLALAARQGNQAVPNE